MMEKPCKIEISDEAEFEHDNYQELFELWTTLKKWTIMISFL